jgi:hypothetical protein
LNEIARECETASGRLSEREREFVSDTVRWTVHGGKPTEKTSELVARDLPEVRR